MKQVQTAYSNLIYLIFYIVLSLTFVSIIKGYWNAHAGGADGALQGTLFDILYCVIIKILVLLRDIGTHMQEVQTAYSKVFVYIFLFIIRVWQALLACSSCPSRSIHRALSMGGGCLDLLTLYARTCWRRRHQARALIWQSVCCHCGSQLDLGRAPYSLYGVEYIDLVFLARSNADPMIWQNFMLKSFQLLFIN